MKTNRRDFLKVLGASAGASMLLPYTNLFASGDEEALKALHAAARREGEVTWYVAQVTSEDAERMAALFEKSFPGVRVNVVRTTAQVAFQRLNQDLRARARNCDVFSTTDVGHVLWLKENGHLMQYTPASAANMFPALQNFDPDGYFHTTSTFLNTIYYNADKVQNPPTKWADIIDPQYAGQVAVGHPGYSGTVGLWAFELHKLYGDEFFKKLAGNRTQVGRSIIDTITTLIAGERLIGCGPNTLAMRAQAAGHNITVVYPEEGSVLSLNPSGIMANTRRPNAAKLFMEWLTGSREVSEYAVSQFGAARVPGIPLREGVPQIDEVKVLRSSAEELVKGIPMVTELWRDVFGV